MSGPEREAMNPEQAADLARLEAMAAEGEPIAGGAENEPSAAQVDLVEALAGAFTVGAMMAGAMGYRRAAELWAPPVCRGLAEKAVPVLQKYPWGQRVLEFLNTGAGVEEVALAFYLMPLAIATRAAVKADEAELAAKAKAKPEAEADDSAVEGEAVTVPEAEASESSGMAWAA